MNFLLLIHRLFITDYDYILEKIGRRDKIEFEREIDVYSDDMEDWWDHFKWILYVLIIYSSYHNNFSLVITIKICVLNMNW